MATFYVDVSEVDGTTHFAPGSQVNGVSCASDGVVTIQKSCAAGLEIAFRWVGEGGCGFLGVEHENNAVGNGPISGTPLSAEIPRAPQVQQSPDDVYTEFGIVDGSPGEVTQWRFSIRLRTPAQPGGFWVDPMIHNEGAGPIGGDESPGGEGHG